jgi:hypothetical protein
VRSAPGGYCQGVISADRQQITDYGAAELDDPGDDFVSALLH